MHLSHASSKTLPTFILYSQPSSYNIFLNTQLFYLEFQPSPSPSPCLQHPIRLKFPLRSWLNQFTVVGSCNGLLCLSEIPSPHSHNDIYIFNPSTGDFIQLPHSGDHGEIFSLGFGFDSTSEQYKVVRIITDMKFFDFSASPSRVNVYTLGDFDWRDVGDGDFKYYIDHRSPGVNVNGRLHWKCCEKVDHHEFFASVACFDLTTDELSVIAFPDFIDELDLVDKVSLVALGGRLSFYRIALHTFCWYRITIWVMKDYGVKESWVKQFVIKDSIVFKPYIEYAIPICLNDNGEILLICGGKQLLAYDPQRESCRELGFYNTLDPVMAIPHVGSLIPPRFDNKMGNRHD